MELLNSSDDSSYESLEPPSPTPPLIYHSDIPVCYEAEIGQLYNVISSPTSSIELTNTSPLSPDGSTSETNEISSQITDAPEESPLPEISTLVFLDLETTGLGRFIGNKNVHITEISMVAVSKFDFQNSQVADLSDIRVVNKLSMCVKPRTRVSMDAARITGLNDSNLYRQQLFDESCAQMVNFFIKRLPQPVCLLAHNGDVFDFPLLKSELHRVGMSLPLDVFTADTLRGARAIGIRDPNNSDKMAAVKKKTGRKRWSYSLENLYFHFFNKRPKACHSSEADCQALMMVCNKMEQIVPWIEKNKKYFRSFTPMW